MAHIAPNDAGWMLYKAGISHHSSATVRMAGTRQIYGIGFKCDSLTDAQRDMLAQYDNIKICASGPAYAPELRSPLIIVKTMAQMRRERSN